MNTASARVDSWKKCARYVAVALLIIGVTLQPGCSSSAMRWNNNQEQHVVRAGETLFSIAWRYGKDPKDLARWNRLGSGSLIYPGQVISLTPTAQVAQNSANKAQKPKTSQTPKPLPTVPSQPPPTWAWPTSGNVVAEFGGRTGTGSGILIAGKMGQPVKAVADGRVVYAGSGLAGYGQLIIIKHNDTYLSAYGHNASLLVKDGQTVLKGQKIATMGKGPGQQPRLHFEIRRNGKPENPRKFLPAR